MLLNDLKEYVGDGYCPMHMPGHKRNTQMLGGGLPYNLDITELRGFDNLQNPRGILKETTDLAAEIYGSDRAFLLINGSTSGILAGIGASVRRGDTILIARNSHMSVYNAAGLFGLKTAYLAPETDALSGINCSVSADAVARGLDDNPGAKLVVVTSPTYEGVISDIYEITKAAHSRGAMLMVDSAHGAHLGLSAAFPPGAVKCGADIVVMSLHKTLPALTQCALLHISGQLADRDETARLLSVFQTSSPSYILLASADRCLRLIKKDGADMFAQYARRLSLFGHSMKHLKNLRVLCCGGDTLKKHPGFFGFDPGKLVISTAKTSISGTELAAALRTDYKIELEAAYSGYALAMTSVCDTDDNFSRLKEALIKIDGETEPDYTRSPDSNIPPPVVHLTLEDALSVREGQLIPPKNAIGMVSLEFVWAYPPGQPIIAPGEVISRESVDYILRLYKTGAEVFSTRGGLPHSIYAACRDGCSHGRTV